MTDQKTISIANAETLLTASNTILKVVAAYDPSVKITGAVLLSVTEDGAYFIAEVVPDVPLLKKIVRERLKEASVSYDDACAAEPSDVGPLSS